MGASIEVFDSAVALIAQKISDEDQSSFWSERMSTIALGLVKPSRQQFDALKLMFDKKVPDAPKTLDVNNKTSVEVLIKGYLENNTDKQLLALEKAKDVTIQEEAITLMLEESTQDDADYVSA